MGQVSGGPEGHDLTRAKPVCSRHILVRPAFKMRVYLGRIVELDREPTYEVGPKLAIYRSAAGCDERSGARACPILPQTRGARGSWDTASPMHGLVPRVSGMTNTPPMICTPTLLIYPGS